jgi:lysozyme
MKTDIKGQQLIQQFEGLSLKPYLCPKKVATIGYGNTFYEDGKAVTMADKPITKERAISLFLNILMPFEVGVSNLVKKAVNQQQFNALVSFAYNVGINALEKSTLLKKVNTNPNDPTIRDEFMKWVKVNGAVFTGLVNRRKAESDMYFSK